MSATITTHTAAQPRLRNLAAARDAYNNSSSDDGLRRELSRDAHTVDPRAGLLPVEDQPHSPSSTWSPFVLSSEAGHNEELAHRGTTLLLRGAKHGITLSLLCASLGDAAGWPAALTVKLNVVMLLCWMVYAACDEVLEMSTYARYYQREPEGEVEEMVQLYAKRGLPEDAARAVVTNMAASPEFFVDVMMLEELQMSPPSGIPPLAAAARLGGGMLFSGGVVLLATAALGSPGRSGSGVEAAPSSGWWHCSSAYLAVLGLAVVALCTIGSLRASITTQQRRRLALQTCASAMPAVLLGRVAGSMLLSGALQA